MNVRRRVCETVFAALVLLCAVVAVENGRVLAEPTLLTGNGGSCVVAWTGLTTNSTTTANSVTGFSIAAGQTMEMRVKCYFGGTPQATEYPTSFFSANQYFDGTSEPSGSWRLCIRSGSSMANLGTFVAGATTLSAFDIEQSGSGYVAWSVSVTRSVGQSTLTVSAPSPSSSWNGVWTTQAACTGATAPGHWFGDGANSRNRSAAWADFDTTDPLYRWGDVFVTTPCSLYTIGGPSSSSTVAAGDSVTFTVAGPASTNPVAFGVQWRAGGAVVAMHPNTASGTSWSYTLTVPNGGPVVMSSVKIRCIPVTGSERWTPYGTWTWTATSGSATRPCVRARLIWPANEMVGMGDARTWTLRLDAPATTDDTLAVAFATFDFMGATQVPHYADLTFTAVTEWSISAPTSGINKSLTAGYNGPLNQFVFRCTDSTGTYYGGWWSASYALSSPGTIIDEADCYDNAGLGLSPASWVPGLLKGMGCIAMDLVVPSEGALDSIAESGNAVATRAPISYVVEISSTLIDFVSSADMHVVAHRNDCITIIEGLGSDADPEDPDIGVLPESELDVCPSLLTSGTADGRAEAFRSIMGGLTWAGGAWMLWTITRRLVAQ